MSENTHLKPWNEYQREYRRRNPEQALKWRYKAAKRLVEKYEREHPDSKLPCHNNGESSNANG